MNLISLIIILIVLAMDSFDITLSKGGSLRKNSLKQNLTFCFLFALVQLAKLSIGYLTGALIESVFSMIAELFGVIVLLIIGIKMISDGIRERNQNIPEKFSIKK